MLSKFKSTMKSIILLFLIALSKHYVQAQILFLPTITEVESDNNVNECRCDLIYNVYDPTCGSNGITYNNPSYLNCDKKCVNPNLTLLHKGQCNIDATILQSKSSNYNLEINSNCNCPTTNEYNPVCGTNGITYNNPSILYCDEKCRNLNKHTYKALKINIRHYGYCREEEYFKDTLPFLSDAIRKCACAYSNEYDPICGTDGYTYPNPSTMSCVSKCNNPSLQVVHYGICRNDQKPHNYGSVGCDCISNHQNYAPICADNGVTYDNFHLFQCAQRCLKRGLQILHENPCRSHLDLDERRVQKDIE